MLNNINKIDNEDERRHSSSSFDASLFSSPEKQDINLEHFLRDKNLLFENNDKEMNINDNSNINDLYSTKSSDKILNFNNNEAKCKPFIETNNNIIPVIRSQSNIPMQSNFNDFDMNIDDHEDFNSVGKYSEISSLNNSFQSNSEFKEISSDCIYYGNFNNNIELKTQSLTQTFKKSCCVKKKAKIHTKRVKSQKNVQVEGVDYENYKQGFNNNYITENEKLTYNHINNINNINTNNDIQKVKKKKLIKKTFASSGKSEIYNLPTSSTEVNNEISSIYDINNEKDLVSRINNVTLK